MRVRIETDDVNFELDMDFRSDQLVVDGTNVNLDEADIRVIVRNNIGLRPIVHVTVGLTVTDPLKALLVGLALGGVRVVEEAVDRAHDDSWEYRSGLLTKIRSVGSVSDLLAVVLAVACMSRDLTVTDPHGRPVAFPTLAPRPGDGGELPGTKVPATP